MGHQDTEAIIPGTEIVYRETDGDSTSSQELVLIPNPTDNPDDPLVSSSLQPYFCCLAQQTDRSPELEHNMEDNRDCQSIRLCLRQHLDASFHRPVDPDIRGRVPQVHHPG